MSYREARTEHDKIKLMTNIQYIQELQKGKREKPQQQKINVYKLHNIVGSRIAYNVYIKIVLKYNITHTHTHTYIYIYIYIYILKVAKKYVIVYNLYWLGWKYKGRFIMYYRNLL